MPDDRRPALSVGFVLLDKFTLAAFGGLIDALRLAADDGGNSRQIHAAWTVMTPGSGDRIASCGLKVTGSNEVVPPENFDYIAVCGGNSYLDETPRPQLDAYLRDASAKGVRLLGICTGSFNIARAGLAKDRTVCVHWNVRDAFEERFPDIGISVDRLFIDEGDLITCAGSTAAIDLGLYLISRHCGRDRAQQAVRHMMLSGIRAPNLPQAFFHQDISGVSDARVRKALHFMEQQLDHPPPLPAIARYVGISVRQLERAFRAEMDTTPSRYNRVMRLNYGRWMIENHTESITRIALDSGFSDAAHFSREFRNHFGLSPSEHRRSLSAHSAV
ncbi:GlxA family transcriptional regulator [Aquamicrobium sp. LC103]|uniref:GlxA family transcriptional regulator n=1 Tax=Aquamicrobium sp. LC103 TaxID=1120658 RepID=UPI00063EC73A|nr:GlxA family transcriptional regulator [Aquamicrobium sp. LC103]TKT69461.1 GlxA family transcriptional regulator [Aquamicrobium sp. LC103]